MGKVNKNYYRSIKQALENGRVSLYYSRNSTLGMKMYVFAVRYFKPKLRKSGWSITAEWYECQELYFERFVKKHRNFDC